MRRNDYCVRRILNNGIHDCIKYFSGNPTQTIAYILAPKWTDDPIDMSVAVMDAVLASQLREHLEVLTPVDPSIRYDIISLSSAHEAINDIDALIKI